MGISEERVLPERETGRQFHGRGRKEDKAIAIFREDGTYRYYDFPPEEYYDGTYSYDEMSGVLTTDDGVNEQTCLTEITVSTMKWIYDEGDGEVLVEYYSRK